MSVLFLAAPAVDGAAPSLTLPRCAGEGIGIVRPLPCEAGEGQGGGVHHPHRRTSR